MAFHKGQQVLIKHLDLLAEITSTQQPEGDLYLVKHAGFYRGSDLELVYDAESEATMSAMCQVDETSRLLSLLHRWNNDTTNESLRLAINNLLEKMGLLETH